MGNKRLFIFAGYDRDKVVDSTLLYYLKSLSELGDIVFTMDNDLPPHELNKITEIPNVLHASAVRHGEYDFGSYKRGYIWARDNKLLNKYDWVYLVNDSVFGPLFDLKYTLEKLETSGADFTGMVECTDSRLPRHIQSWFVGLGRHVVKNPQFDDFITNITHQSVKAVIVYKYEMRLTQMLLMSGYKYSAIYSDSDTLLYRKPWWVISHGVPFIKKLSFDTNAKIQYLYPYLSREMLSEILRWAHRYNVNLCSDSEIWHEPYHKLHRLTLFGVPLLTIYVKTPMDSSVSYKVCLFTNLPIFKFSTQKPRI